MHEYDIFINSIQSSRENVYFPVSERHHIIPRCMGGSDDDSNLIYLTLREHFVAHKLLCDKYPDNTQLAYALLRMCDYKREYTEEEYEQARLNCVGKKLPVDTCEKISKSLREYQRTEEHCRHISEGKRGKKTGDDNVMRNPEVAKKVSEAFKGEKNPMYGRTGSKHHLYGVKYYWYNDGVNNHRVPQTDEAVSNAIQQGWVKGKIQKEVVYDEDLRKKMGDSHRGYKHSEETKELIRSKVTGQKRTDEQKARMREGHKGSIYHMTCRECGKEFISKVPGVKYCNDCRR